MSHYENSVSSNEYEVEAIQNDRKKRVYDRSNANIFLSQNISLNGLDIKEVHGSQKKI